MIGSIREELIKLLAAIVDDDDDVEVEDDGWKRRLQVRTKGVLMKKKMLQRPWPVYWKEEVFGTC